MSKCKSIACTYETTATKDFCPKCEHTRQMQMDFSSESAVPMSERYPQYYKDVSDLDELDVYQIHHLFNIQDASGCIQHASKKLLLSGVRTGGKSHFKDIKEARDTLTRWLQINEYLAK